MVLFYQTNAYNLLNNISNLSIQGAQKESFNKLLRSDEAKPSEEELESLKSNLLLALKQVTHNIVKEYSK